MAVNSPMCSVKTVFSFVLCTFREVEQRGHIICSGIKGILGCPVNKETGLSESLILSINPRRIIATENPEFFLIFHDIQKNYTEVLQSY